MTTTLETVTPTSAPVLAAFPDLIDAQRLMTVIDKNALDAVRTFQHHVNTACPYAPSGMYYQALSNENTWGFSIEKLWEQLGNQLEETFSTLLSAPSVCIRARTLEEATEAEVLAGNLQRLQIVARTLFAKTRNLTSDERQGLRKFYRLAYKKI